MNQFKQRLDALEAAERTARGFPALFTTTLMFTYAEDEEIAQWEFAGKPAIDRAALGQVLDQVYGQSEKAT